MEILHLVLALSLVMNVALFYAFTSASTQLGKQLSASDRWEKLAKEKAATLDAVAKVAKSKASAYR